MRPSTSSLSCEHVLATRNTCFLYWNYSSLHAWALSPTATCTHSFIHPITSMFSAPTMCHALFIHLKDKAKLMNKSMILQSCGLVTKSCPIPLGPHGLQPTRFLCPWAFPGKNTGVSCHVLLQGIFLTQELNLHLLHCRQILHHWPTGEALCKEKCYISNSSYYTTNWSALK